MHFEFDNFLIDDFLINYLVIRKKETLNADVAGKQKKSEILVDGKSSYDKKITVSASV